MSTPFEQNGGGPQKQPKYVPIFLDRSFTGIFTQRSVLHDPADIFTAKYYGGRPDAIWMGSNIELTNRLTLQRRPGLTQFCTAPATEGFHYPVAPDRAYSFQLTDGSIRVIVDTTSTPNFVLTAVAAPAAPLVLTGSSGESGGANTYFGAITGGASGGLIGNVFQITGFVQPGNDGLRVTTNSSTGNLVVETAQGVPETHAGLATNLSAVYTGTIPGGANNAYAGYIFSVTGFGNNNNNGTYMCTASTSTTLTLTNPKATPDSTGGAAISAGAVYWDRQDGTAQLLFAKSPGAGQTYFVASGGILYMGDGVDTRKYTPLNPNYPVQTYLQNPLFPFPGIPGNYVSIWNWGIATPTVQPNVIAVASGSAGAVWEANTFFTTMGLTVDIYGNVWQLTGVNAAPVTDPNPLGVNATFGTAGSGGPSWNNSLAALTVETSGTPITWQNMGVITEWASGGIYGDAGTHNPGAPVCVYDPVTKALYLNFNGAGGLSKAGTVEPVWVASPGWNFTEGHGAGGSPYNKPHWFFFGLYADMFGWIPSHVYTQWFLGGPGEGEPSDAVIEPFVQPFPASTAVYLEVPTSTGGTSGSASAYQPFPNPAIYPGSADVGSSPVIDGMLSWMPLGQGAWQKNHQYVPWTAFGTDFGIVFDGTNMQVCTAVTGSGLSGATEPGVGGNPPWGTTYSAKTQDNDVTWTCVGPPTTWVSGGATTGIWNLPTTGFQPPQPSQTYGGSTVDGSGYVQTVIVSGKSGSSAPSWNSTGHNTTDNTITWYAESAISTNSLAWKTGYAYAFSYKARAFDDFYSPPPLGGLNGVQQIPPGWAGALGIPTGSATEAVSSASPANTTLTGANTGAVNFITGPYSPDPQVDTIIIWRSDDGGGSGQMYELTEIPNIPSLAIANWVPGDVGWKFADYLPDVATSTNGGTVIFPGLNTSIPAPINEVNDPPFSTFLPMVYNFERIWGAIGEDVPFSGGPDTEVGNPDEAFAPADFLPFLAPVKRIVKSAQGMVTFLTDSIEVIAGGPLTSSFFSVTWVPGIGLLSYNALDVLGGEMYFFSSDNNFRIMTPALNVVNAGFALGDQFANQPSSGISDTIWNPNDVYVASHQSGTDNAIFVADGSTGWYRLNARQDQGIASTPTAVWSPYANITNGCYMVQSVEIIPGIKKLLVGPTETSVLSGINQILERNQTVFTDNGAMYDAYYVQGAINLAHPGQLAVLKFIEFDFSGVNFQPTVSYLLDEIGGAPYTSWVNTAYVYDPPSLYGRTLAPVSYSPNRYYFLSNASLARCRYLLLKVDFGETPNGDEVYTTTIVGRLMVET